MANERFTFKNYSALQWLENNKASVKWALAGTVSLAAMGTGKWALLIGMAAKFALDAVDYWLKE
jgi:hypothetical protein